ncbi:MAG: phosphoribosyltransferase [Thaumarchaeota archaeon]|nr:phosphoribosyltransferase [Nitrososphaerota archaeon]
MGSSSLSWSEIERCARTLAGKVRDTDVVFDKIATVSRGGLIPARLLADQLDIKTILVDKYLIPEKTLFVDDIYDSGKTFRKIAFKTKSPSTFVYATLMARKGIRYPKQLVYARKTRGNEYIIFPWEKNERQKSHNTKDKKQTVSKPGNN